MNKMTKFAAAALLGSSALAMNANAHVVGIGYIAQSNGDVTFYANQYHGNRTTAPGTLLLNGNNYSWDGYVHDTNYSALSLDQYSYNSYGARAFNVEDWLTVTISGLTDGTYTASTNSGSIYDRWYGGAALSFNINVVEQTSVSEPATLALIGLGLAGIGATRRRKTQA